MAAIRELAEETGWTDVTLLGEVHRRIHIMDTRAASCTSMSGFTWPEPTSPVARSSALMRCTLLTASPPGAGGPWLNWTQPPRRSGLPNSLT